MTKMRFLLAAALAFLVSTQPVQAHDEEHPPVRVWVADGQIAADFDFTRRETLYETFCSPGTASCLYTAIDPGFLIADAIEPETPQGWQPLAAGTELTMELVAIDSGLTVVVNGNRLSRAGARARLGTTPDLHVHPSWQLLTADAPGTTFSITYRLTAGDRYAPSPDLTHVFVAQAAVPDPTPTPTPPVEICAGDCDGDTAVTVDEIQKAVRAALTGELDCDAVDTDESGSVTVDEILTALGHALEGCSNAIPVVRLSELQTEIFDRSCAFSGCHNVADRVAGLDLSAGATFDATVGVEPATDAARTAGMKLIDPGDPENSFLYVKVGSPKPQFGGRMPIGFPALADDEVTALRNWILRGAPND